MISAAKEELWKIAGEETLGKITKRQGSSKTKNDLDDISSAMEKLSTNNVLPMFLGTSKMIMKTPVYNTDPNNCDNGILANRLKVLEEAVNSLIKVSKKTAAPTLKPLQRLNEQDVKDNNAISADAEFINNEEEKLNHQIYTMNPI